jgi:ribonucleotide monophosphatase NagD (HAD superfamily)
LYFLVVYTKPLPPLDVCGKPNPKLFEIIKKDTGVDLNKSCMVGDRLDTDIKMVTPLLN